MQKAHSYGTVLGLSIAKAFAKLHGVSLTCESENSASSSDFILLSAAKSAVTSRPSGAKIAKIEPDYEGGRYVYEGEAYVNGREYDFKVDALTGSLIKWEKDDGCGFLEKTQISINPKRNCAASILFAARFLLMK